MSTEIGTLVVVVLKARNLLDKHSFFKQDVYTKVTLNGVTKQTRVEVKGGQHPEWDDELRFSVTEATKKKGSKLEVACWSKEPRTDDLVGKGEVDIAETLQSGEFDDWVPLNTSTGVQRGDLYLEMTFYASGPPPLSRRPSKLDPATRLSRPPSTVSQSTSQYHHAGLQNVLSSNESLHAPSNTHPGRVSPRPEPPLPSLPEETSPHAPDSVPAFLRPGAGRPGNGRHSPQPPINARPSSTSPHTSPAPPHQPPSSTSPPLSHPQSSIDDVPGILRAGPSRGRTTTTESSHSHARGGSVPVVPIPPIGNGYVPATSPEPIHHHSGYTPYPQPQKPIPALPSTPHPAPAPAPTPTYSPAPWQQSPPSTSHTLPPLQPSTYSVDSIPPLHPSTARGDSAPPPVAPGFSFPTPQVSLPPFNPPAAYPPYPANTTYYNYQSPPPLAGHMPPPARPYPYNYAPPPRDPDLDVPDVLKKERYSKPLPLPDEPSGMTTPTPAHPHPTPHTIAPSPPAHTHTHHHHEPQHREQPKRESTAERDRRIALELEREEEERRRKEEEQEELDREMARKLDLELNLENVDEPVERVTSPRQPADMPGSWYRHRVEV